jgi:hypothetical protein
MPSSKSARLYITLIALAGTAAFVVGLMDPVLTHPARFVALMSVAVLSSRLKVNARDEG